MPDRYVIDPLTTAKGRKFTGGNRLRSPQDKMPPPGKYKPSKTPGGAPAHGGQRTVAVPHPYPVCGFVNGFDGPVAVYNKMGAPCGQPAGALTYHAGVGRCNRHYGTIQVVTDSWKYYKGKYAKFVNKNVHFQEKLDEVRADTEVFDLRREILHLRALTEVLIENNELATAVQAAKASAVVAQKLHEIEVGRRYVISIENINIIIRNTVDIIRRHVADERTIKLIANDLARMNLTGESVAPIALTPNAEGVYASEASTD
jgi:hypothetical protein